MALSKGAKVGIGLSAIAGIAAIVGVASAKVISPSHPPSSSPYKFSTFEPIYGYVDFPVLISVELTDNGSPVSGVVMTLTELKTGSSNTDTTNAEGVANFRVTFNAQGIYALQASAVVLIKATKTTIKSQIFTVSINKLFGGV